MKKVLWRGLLSTLTVALFVFASSCGDSGGTDNLTIVGNGTGSDSSAKIAAKNSGIGVASFNVAVNAIYLSENDDCSDPVLVTENDTPERVEMLDDPELFSGDVDPGTYECVILCMQDTINFVPEETSDDGACVANENSVLDVCRAPSQDGGGTYIDIDGNEQDCSGTDDDPEADDLCVYVTTAASGNNGDGAFDPNQGLPLGAPLVITDGENTTVNFIIDASPAATGGVSDSDGRCDMPPPEMSFEEE